jgi:hypothetical protein
MTPKTLFFQTNYNNKLACQCFIHIDVAPKVRIPESQLERPLEIRTADNSHPPIQAKIVDMLRLPLRDITSIFSWPSHGLDSLNFKLWMMEKQTPADQEMAVYFYSKM